MNSLGKVLNSLGKVLGAICILVWLVVAFLIGTTIRTPLEVQRGITESDQQGLCPSQVCICNCGDVYVDCCCPTEVVDCRMPTATPEQADTTPTPTPTTRGATTPTQTPVATRIITRIPRTPTDVPPSATPTPTVPVIPTKTVVVECFQWLCHKPGTAAEQDYCCESQGCVDAHLKHGDYLGRCLDD